MAATRSSELASGRSQVQVHELVEVAGLVVAERAAAGEAPVAVERQSRLERGSPPGLQRKPAEAAAARLADDMVQQRRRHALTQVVRVRAHGLQLAPRGVQL